MEPINLLDAKSRDELREWLKINHKTAAECWVVVMTSIDISVTKVAQMVSIRSPRRSCPCSAAVSRRRWYSARINSRFCSRKVFRWARRNRILQSSRPRNFSRRLTADSMELMVAGRSPPPEDAPATRPRYPSPAPALPARRRTPRCPGGTSRWSRGCAPLASGWM